jgi:hypothetical protein
VDGMPIDSRAGWVDREEREGVQACLMEEQRPEVYIYVMVYLGTVLRGYAEYGC